MINIELTSYRNPHIINMNLLIIDSLNHYSFCINKNHILLFDQDSLASQLGTSYGFGRINHVDFFGSFA